MHSSILYTNMRSDVLNMTIKGVGAFSMGYIRNAESAVSMVEFARTEKFSTKFPRLETQRNTALPSNARKISPHGRTRIDSAPLGYTPRSDFVLLIIFLLGLMRGYKITKSFL